MRSLFMIVSAALVAGAAFALPAKAETIAANTGGLSHSAGGELSAALTSDQLSSRHRRGHRTGARSGSRVGGPNNARPTGTQAPDAQMGGSGKGGAR